MATKRKTKKKATKSKGTGGKRVPPKQKGKTFKRLTKKKSPSKKAVTKRKTVSKRKISRKRVRAANRNPRQRSQGRNAVTFPREASGSRSGEQSGDLQGLSNVEDAASESVDELLEEGNAFEAEVVTGIEEAGDHGEREVRTHEVPEDDVPGEYMDKD
jgi:hypothetical protein